MNPLIRRWIFFLALASGVVFFLWTIADTMDFMGRTSPEGAPIAVAKSHVDWKDIPQRHPVSEFIQLPTDNPIAIPKIQADTPEETPAQIKERLARRKEVRDTFEKAWKGYKSYAWLQDEITPLSRSSNNKYGGWAATLVDNLDTLLIMGLEKEFVHAVAALKKIDYTTSKTHDVNVFETTIRHLGGLLSAYDLDNGKHPILLEKAAELGETLYHAFDTPNRMPMSRWNWQLSADDQEHEHSASPNAVVAEIGSLTLEFTRLSQLTGDPRFYDNVQRITNALQSQQNDTKIPGLWPVYVNSRRLSFTTDRTFTLGAMADSLYEYFPKQYMLLGGLKQQYRAMYEQAIDAAKEYLFFRPMTPDNAKILISGTAQYRGINEIILKPEGQHLTCFVGGMVGIASRIFDRPADLEIAQHLADGCVWAYENMQTGIMPEIFTAVPCNVSSLTEPCTWDEDVWLRSVAERHMSKELDTPDFREKARKYADDHRIPPGFANINDARYLLRPEAIESVFMLYRITGDRAWQDKAWRMFRAVQSMTETSTGAAAIQDVSRLDSKKINECESFWMAETLKYYYLVFEDWDVISLDEWVFNTEAHALRRPRAGERPGGG